MKTWASEDLESHRRLICAAGRAMLPGNSDTIQEGTKSMDSQNERGAASALQPDTVERWAPHPDAAPQTEKRDDTFLVAANGTRTCVGGWQFRFAEIQPGRCYHVEWEVEHDGITDTRDVLHCKSYWGSMQPTDARSSGMWDYLLPRVSGERSLRFGRRLTAPANATHLTLRCVFRWTTHGRSIWKPPQVTRIAAPEPRKPVKVAVVTGRQGGRRGPFQSIQDNLNFYLPLCEDTCAHKPDLIVLPEIALQWGLQDSALDSAVPAVCTETAPFASLAHAHKTRVLLGMFERDGDAVHNSAVLFGPDGSVEGCYHKVHLAVGGEEDSGILAGDGFPVFDTEIGRIGCNICMDSSAAESSRMVGLNGADFLLMPIMGDHRADRWSRGSPIYSEDRWKAIMRTHAIDSQLCMVIARNNGLGSCIIDRKGDILAWNEGDADFITATINLDDAYRTWNGGCFRDVNWLQRRPHLYGAFVDPNNVGSSIE